MMKRSGRFDRKMLRTIFSLAWPTMLEQLMQTAVQYIDTAMVGVLGTAALAAVGSTGTINWLVMATVNGIAVGFLSFIARAFGAGEQEKARRAAAQAIFIVLALGLFLTVLLVCLSDVIPVWMQVDPQIRDLASAYFLIAFSPVLFRTATAIFGMILRAVGDTRSPMRVGILVNLVNIILNFFLIYPVRTVSVGSVSFTVWGADLGVQGAAAASAAAYVTGGVVLFLVFLRHPVISPVGYSLRPDRTVLEPCFRVAFPNMLQRFGTSLGFVVFAAMINSLGGTATAAHSIANTVESAFYIPGWGMQAAAATLAGHAYGAEDEQRMRGLSSTVMPLEILLMCVSGGLLFVFAPSLMSLFSTDSAVITLGGTVLRMVAVSEPFYGVSIVMEGLMQGVGKTVLPLVINLIGMWGLRIVGTFICTQLLGYGLVSAWACMIAHNLAMFFVFGFLYVTRRWDPLLKTKKEPVQ